MSYENSGPASDGPSAESISSSRQNPLSLAEVLQMCCVAFKTGQITFRSNESSGYVYLQHGRVLHAVCGVMEGEEAIYRMLSWPSGTFFMDEDILPHKRTVTLTWEQLLFEGARRADDLGAVRDLLITPVKTVEPVTSTRSKDSLPKLTLNLPDQRPLIYEIQAEYTHIGRASGNEVPLAYPSVSNRHCIFILSGPDVILRDLNSSNGTVVNGETIKEVILRPGDLIQVGVVQIKFEPGVRRPKLTQSSPTAFGQGSDMWEASARAPSFQTVKLPARGTDPAPVAEIKDDAAFVKGESAISYHNLAKPEVPSKSRPWVLIIFGVIVLLAVLCGGYYYFVLRPH